MRKFTTRIYTKANYLLNLGRMALSNQRGDFTFRTPSRSLSP